MNQYENVMFSERGSGRSKLQIKLIDFGLSMKYGKKKGQLDMSTEMTDFVGTIYTMGELDLNLVSTRLALWSHALLFKCCLAPEVIRGNYT